jgi:hypothetical protein
MKPKRAQVDPPSQASIGFLQGATRAWLGTITNSDRGVSIACPMVGNDCTKIHPH